MSARAIAVIATLGLLLTSAWSCTIKIPPDVAAELTPPDGQRPNNYELQEPDNDEAATK